MPKDFEKQFDRRRKKRTVWPDQVIRCLLSSSRQLGDGISVEQGVGVLAWTGWHTSAAGVVNQRSCRAKYSLKAQLLDFNGHRGQN